MLGLLLQGVMNAKIFMGKDWENFYLGFYMGQVILWRCPAYSTRFSGSETAIITFFTWSLVGWAENATGVSSVSSLFSSIPRDSSPCHSHCRHIPRVWSARTTGNQTWSTPHRKKKKKKDDIVSISPVYSRWAFWSDCLLLSISNGVSTTEFGLLFFFWVSWALYLGFLLHAPLRKVRLCGYY